MSTLSSEACMQAQGTEGGPDSGASGLKEELTSDAKQLGNSAQRRVEEEAEKRKGGIASQAKSVGSALDRAASELDREDSPDWVRSLVRQTAGTVQNLADKLDNKSAGELTEEIRRFGRQQPAKIGRAHDAAGFATTRLLRAGKAASAKEGWQEHGERE